MGGGGEIKRESGEGPTDAVAYILSKIPRLFLRKPLLC